jgi:hypothetical protein
MENFIHVFNVHTQIDLLQSIKTHASGITLWQALSDEQLQRKLMKIRGLKLNVYDNLLEITPKKKDHSFDSKLPVYFYAQHRTSIFKTKIVFNSNFKVILKWPDNFLIGDERDMPRSYNRKNKIITFNLRINNHIDKEFQKPIIDDSALGLSIRVPYNEIQYFDEGAVVKINYKSDVKQGRINYITPLLDKMYPNHLRVGIVYH